MENSGKQPARRLKGWHVALAVLLALIGLTTLYVVVTRNRLGRRLEALRAAGYPTTFAELAEYNKLPAGSPNAASAYVAAFAAFVPLPDGANTPCLGTAQLPDRGKPLPEPMARAISEYLASNRQCLALLHEAAGIRDCDYGCDPLHPGETSPHDAIRRCAQLLALGAIHHLHNGDPNAAVRCIEDGLRLADSLRQEAATTSYVVRVTCLALALKGLEQGLNVATFTDGQLTELDEALATTAGTHDLTHVLVGERCLMLEMCRDPSLMTRRGQSIGSRTFSRVTRTGVDDTLSYMEDCIRAAKLPPAQRLEAYREAIQKVKDLSFIHFSIRLDTWGTSHMAELAEFHARACARIDLARVALAVERYRLATGKLPEQLDELVPRYLERVPIDPFGNQPIRYRRTEPGYLLHSIDTDGRDDGGHERKDDNADGPYDLCFIVTR